MTEERSKYLRDKLICVIYDCGYEKAKSDVLKELRYIKPYSKAESDMITRIKNSVKMLRRADDDETQSRRHH